MVHRTIALETALYKPELAVMLKYAHLMTKYLISRISILRT